MINARVGLVRNSSIATADFNMARINFKGLCSQVLSDGLQDTYLNFKDDYIPISLIQTLNLEQDEMLC